MIESNKPYEYFAFISYKREDEKWAKWLQHKLEYYKLPTSVRRDNPELPDKIRPVFKDTTDLEPGVLAQKIQSALDSSKFLIVICSPRSANSVWVSKEVQSFIDSGRVDHIIPFIIGGTPNASDPKEECFPEGLRQLAGEQELLGANINEMGRDAAAIKVVARMFNLRFDTLWQRYQKSKKRKRITLITFIILFAIVCLVVGSYISRQNLMLEKVNESLRIETQRANSERNRANDFNLQLISANDSINRSNKRLEETMYDLDKTNHQLIHTNKQLNDEKIRVEEALNNLKISQINREASILNQQLASGRTLEVARSVLPLIPHDNNQQPLVPMAMDVLNQAMYILGKDEYKQVDLLPDDTQFSPNGLYCVYNVDGEYLLYDIHGQTTTKLSGEDRIDYNNIFFSNTGDTVYGIGCNKCFVWGVNDRNIINEFDIEAEFSEWLKSDHDGEFSPSIVNGIEQYSFLHNSINKRWEKYGIIHYEIFDTNEYLKLFPHTINNVNLDCILIPKNSQLNTDFNYSPNIPIIIYREGDYNARVINLSRGTTDYIYTSLKERSYNRMIAFNNETEVVINSQLYTKHKISNLRPQAECLYRDSMTFNSDFPARKTYIENIIFKGNKFRLIDCKYGAKLYMQENEYSAFSKLLLISKNLTKEFTPYIAYTMGNGIGMMQDAYLLNDHEVLISAAQGRHSVYNAIDESRRYFSSSNINTFDSPYCHAQMFIGFSQIIDKNRLVTISGGGVISIFDIPTGCLMIEYFIPLPKEYIDEKISLASLYVYPEYVSADGLSLYTRISGGTEDYYIRYTLPSIEEFIFNAKYQISKFWDSTPNLTNTPSYMIEAQKLSNLYKK